MCQALSAHLLPWAQQAAEASATPQSGADGLLGQPPGEALCSSRAGHHGGAEGESLSFPEPCRPGL